MTSSSDVGLFAYFLAVIIKGCVVYLTYNNAILPIMQNPADPISIFQAVEGVILFSTLTH